MAARAAYPSDLTDQQFAVIEPLLPARKSGTPNGGRPPLPWREIVNSILYILRTGASWCNRARCTMLTSATPAA